MAITLRGVGKASAIDGGNAVIDLTALTGGSGAAALEGDVVFVHGGCSGAGAVTLPGGYTLAFDSTTNDVGYKRMGASPDTSLTVTGTGTATQVTVGVCVVLTGVDAASPLDVAATSATATSTNPDNPSITPVTDNAWVLAFFFASGLLDAAVTAPSGYSNQVDTTADDTADATVGCATKQITPPAAEDPASWTNVGSSTWRAVSVAVRPAISVPVAMNHYMQQKAA